MSCNPLPGRGRGNPPRPPSDRTPYDRVPDSMQRPQRGLPGLPWALDHEERGTVQASASGGCQSARPDAFRSAPDAAAHAWEINFPRKRQGGGGKGRREEQQTTPTQDPPGALVQRSRARPSTVGCSASLGSVVRASSSENERSHGRRMLLPRRYLVFPRSRPQPRRSPPIPAHSCTPKLGHRAVRGALHHPRGRSRASHGRSWKRHDSRAP